MFLNEYIQIILNDPLIVVCFVLTSIILSIIIVFSQQENFDRDCLNNVCPACKTNFNFAGKNLMFLENKNDDYIHISCPKCLFGHKINKSNISEGQYQYIEHLISKNN